METLFILFTVASVSSEVRLSLSSDGPAVLDAPVRFNAVVSHPGPFVSKELKWRWSDDSAPGHYLEYDSDNPNQTYIAVYGDNEYEAGSYRMKLTVFAKYFEFWEVLIKDYVDFNVTETLNGRLNVETPFRNNVVSTLDETKIDLRLYDPGLYLKNATLSYFWLINDTFYGQTDEANFVERFKSVGSLTVEAFVLASFNASSARNGTSKAALLESLKAGEKHGIFRTSATVMEPITEVKTEGDLWLKHGRLLDLDVSCDGSGPWTYCWSMKSANYNVTGNETCYDGESLERCRFSVDWYYRQSGEHKVLTVVENAVSKIVKLYVVTVYDVRPQTPLSFVILPVTSAIGVIVAVTAATILMIKFKRRLAVETADFDFTVQDDRLEYKTFWERLRDSMLNAFGNASDDVSRISSDSSNATGGSAKAPVGIHYGSIT